MPDRKPRITLRRIVRTRRYFYECLFETYHSFGKPPSLFLGVFRAFVFWYTARHLSRCVKKACFSGENSFFACLTLRTKAAKKEFSPEKLG